MGANIFRMALQTDLDSFLTACAEIRLPLVKEEVMETFEDLELEMGVTDDTEILGAKAHGGRLFIWGDESSEVCLCPDFPVMLSDKLKTRAVMGAAHSSSGTYLFVQADSGRIIRFFYAAYLGAPGSVEMGQPLSCEGLKPLDLPSGEGIDLALTSCGFDFESEVDEGPFYTLSCPEDKLEIVQTDLSGMIEEHLTKAPKDYKPSIKVDVSFDPLHKS